MMPKLDQREIEKMLKQMGVESSNIEAKRVVIEGFDEDIVIENPQVILTSMQGQNMYQITGDVKLVPKMRDADIKMVMEQANCSREQAIKALQDNGGDLAEAILSLKQD